MKKLNCILLVEDDDTTNFYHQFLIEKLHAADHVAVARNGQEALEYLGSALEGKAVRPDLILLDINMPVMDGFEFIEHYERLPREGMSQVLVVLLTSSMHPTDIERAKAHPVIAEYLYKPLLETSLSDVVGRHFGG